MTEHLATELNDTYSSNKAVVCCPILQGATKFFIETSKHFTFDPVVEYIGVSSYEGDQQKAFKEYRMPNPEKVKDKTVLVFDDILDSGNTMNYITDRLYEMGAAKVVPIVLLKRKSTKHVSEIETRYLFSIGDEWIWGYGMDAFDGTGRTLEDIVFDEKN